MEAVINKFNWYLAGIAWSSWKELGVAGTDRYYENCLIQPEELIILTSILAKYDHRLCDEALDWCSRYHEFISVSRTRALLKNLGPQAEHCFSQFAASLNSISSAKWPSTEKINFPTIKVSGKSILPPLEAPSLLALRLRSLFGPGARADILTCFMTRNKLSFSAADLEAIGYTKRSLLTALDHLARSGILTTTNMRNRKSYELRAPKELQVIIGKLPKTAPPWNKILQAVVAIQSIVPELQKSSEKTQTVILRNCLIKIEPLLQSFIQPILYNKPNFHTDWKSLMDCFKAFQQGNFFMQYEVLDELDKIVIHLLQNFFLVYDCVDGIETIEDKVQFKADIHSKVYKKCYQLFLSFASDLEIRIAQFLKFPFYKVMDELLAEIPSEYSKEKLPQLLEAIKSIKSLDQITSPQLALREYQKVMPALHNLQQFIASFRKRLEDLYFVKTNVYLLTLPSELHKRHLVLDLFKS